LPKRLFYERQYDQASSCSDALEAVSLIMQAIGDIAFVLTGTTDSQEAASILNDFFEQEDNRISISKCPGDGRRRKAGRRGDLL
jgi:hypothetical protein